MIRPTFKIYPEYFPSKYFGFRGITVCLSSLSKGIRVLLQKLKCSVRVRTLVSASRERALFPFFISLQAGVYLSSVFIPGILLL